MLKPAAALSMELSITSRSVDIVGRCYCDLKVRTRVMGKMDLMMKMALFLVFALIGVVPTTDSQMATISEKMPIGALFDRTRDEEIRAAFSYELSAQNKRQQRLTLSGQSINIFDMNNSYNVSHTICRFMSHGVFLFYASHTMASLATFKSYSTTFQMPFITSSIATKTVGQDLGYELYLRPYYAKAIVDIIKHYKWKEVLYLYDSNEGLERLQQLLDEFAKDGYIVKVRFHRVSNAADAHLSLHRLDSRNGMKGMNVLLDLPSTACEDLLHRVYKEIRGMIDHYLLVGLGIDDINAEFFAHGEMNVTGFRLVDRKNATVRAFLNDWAKLDPKFYKGAGTAKISYEAALAVDAVSVISRALLRMVHEEPTVFNETLNAGLVNNNGTVGIDCEAEPVETWQHGYDIMKALKEVEFGGLTGDVRFDKFGLRRDYKLDIYTATLNRGLVKLGYWHSEKGLHIQPIAIVRPCYFNGQNLFVNRTRVVTSILTKPYLMIKEQPRNGPVLKGNDLYEGYCADLAKKISEFVKFEYIISPVKDNKYGQKDENASWNGMVGELIRREADLAIAPLTITAEREKVINFSDSFMSLGISIMIKKPKNDPPSVFFFMNPLSRGIWMCVLFAFVGVSVVLVLVRKFSAFGWRIEDQADDVLITRNITILNRLWFSLRTFIQQGFDNKRRSISGRIVGSVWWFFTVIIISSYTANLAAFLTIERMQSPIESAEDLTKQTKIKYGMINSGSTLEFFKRSTIPVYERMWAFMQTAEPSVMVGSTEDGVSRVRNGKYAFLIESTTNDYINQQPPCDTMKVGNNLNSKGYGIGTPLGSDFRDHIALAVLELKENGELQKLEKLWWYDKNEKHSCGDDNRTLKLELTSSLKLQNVAGIFYILIGGLSLALVVATCEFLYKSKVEARRRKDKYPATAQVIDFDEYTIANTNTQAQEI